MTGADENSSARALKAGQTKEKQSGKIAAARERVI
jgi:hypothetical protein